MGARPAHMKGVMAAKHTQTCTQGVEVRGCGGGKCSTQPLAVAGEHGAAAVAVCELHMAMASSHSLWQVEP